MSDSKNNRYYAERRAEAMAAERRTFSGEAPSPKIGEDKYSPRREEAQAHFDNGPEFTAYKMDEMYDAAPVQGPVHTPAPETARQPEIFHPEPQQYTTSYAPSVGAEGMSQQSASVSVADYSRSSDVPQYHAATTAAPVQGPAYTSAPEAARQPEIFRPEPQQYGSSYAPTIGSEGLSQQPAIVPAADYSLGSDRTQQRAAYDAAPVQGPAYMSAPEAARQPEIFHPEPQQPAPSYASPIGMEGMSRQLSAGPAADYSQGSGILQNRASYDAAPVQGSAYTSAPKAARQPEIFHPEPQQPAPSYTSPIGMEGMSQQLSAGPAADHSQGSGILQNRASYDAAPTQGPVYTSAPETAKRSKIFHPELQQVEASKAAIPVGQVLTAQDGGKPVVHDVDYYMSLPTKYATAKKVEHDADYYMSQDSPGVRKYRAMYERDQAARSANRFSSGSLGSDVAAYNSYLARGQKIDAIKGRLVHAADMGASLLKQQISDRDEEGHAVEDVAENVHVVGFAGGGFMDNMEMSDIVERNMLMVNRQTRAGNIFKSDLYKDRDIFKPAAFAGARIVDRNKVTKQDIEIFEMAESLGHDNLNNSVLHNLKSQRNIRNYRNKIEKMVLSSEINSFEEFVRTINREEPGFFTEAEKLVLEREDALLIARNPLDFERNAQIIKKVLADPRLIGEFADVDLDALGTRELKDLVRRRKRGLFSRGKNLLLDIEKNPLFAAGIKALYQNQISLEAAKRVQARRLARAVKFRNWTKGRVFRLLDNDADFAAMRTGVSAEMSAFRTGVTLAGDVIKVGAMAGYGTGSLINAGFASGLDMFGADGAARTVRGAGKTVNAGLDITKKTIRDITSLPGNTVKRAGQAVGTTAGNLTGTAAVKITTTLTETAAYRAFVSNPAVKFISSRAFHARLFIKRQISTIANIIKYPSRFLRKVFGIGGKGMRIAAGIVGGLILLECVFVLLFSGNAAPSSVISLILSNEDQFADYQKKYDQMDEAFTNRVSAIANGYAQTKDYSGATIHYGINRPAQNLQGYANTAEPALKAYDLPEEFQNGIHLAYLYNGSSASGLSSNIKDCVAAMAVIMGQDQSAHHAEALDLLGALYQSTHSYIAKETPLYYCSHGDRLLHYYCNEKAQNYPSSPLLANTQVKKFEEPFDPEKNGFICSIHQKEYPDDMKMYAGCQKVDSPEDYTGVETKEYETIEDTYDSEEDGEVEYTYKEGIDNANPAINTLGATGKKLCFHNGGYGEKVADYDYVKEGKTADFQQAASTTKLNQIFEAIKDQDEAALEKFYDSDYWTVSFPEWTKDCDNLGYYYFYDQTGNLDRDAVHTGIRGLVVYCMGHDHYGCESGHDVPVCYGHVDLNMTIAINGIEKIFELGGVPVSGDNTEVDRDLLAGAKKKDSAEVASTEAADEDDEEDVVVRYDDTGEEEEEDEEEE